MTTSAIQPVSFSFQESHDVRIHLIDSEPWFCLKDVCAILDIQNSSDLLAKQLDRAGVEKIYLRSGGQNRQLTFVNEPNLYRVIFRSNKPEARQFQDWVFNDVLPAIRKTGSYTKPAPAKKPASEPISAEGMRYLTHLVWQMSHGMRSEQAWSNGIWHCLRSVTGRAYPQRYCLDDRPALEEECRRIMKVTCAFNAAVYNFEKDVIRLVIRRRQDIEPVIALMEEQLRDMTERYNSGLLALGAFEENSLRKLVSLR